MSGIPSSYRRRYDHPSHIRITSSPGRSAATNGHQSRPATAHNARTIRANLGYVRPERLPVEDRRRTAATAANTAAKPMDNAGPGWTAVKCRPSTQTAMDGPRRLA